MTLYLHTLDGRPAVFVDGHLCYAHLRIKPARSLRQIRREQAVALEWEKAWKARTGDKAAPLPMSYVTIVVPT